MDNEYDRLGSLTLLKQPVRVKENTEFKPALFNLKIELGLQQAEMLGLYARVGWKFSRQSKILIWNVTKMRFIFQLCPPSSPHISPINVAVLGSHWSKRLTADSTSSYELFSL